MEFCPKCRMRMSLINRMGKLLYKCVKCEYELEPTRDRTILPSITKRPDEIESKERIAVLGKREQESRTLPKIKTECPKCGNREAFWWMVQIRSADESPTQFFRCTKCEYTWREAS